MKVYIATKWENKPAAREVRKQLIEMGHKVTSQWLDTGEYDGPAEIAAQRDINDVLDADVLLLLQDGYNIEGGCGMWVEMGIAIAEGMPVVVISNTLTKRSVFHSAWNVDIIKTVGDLRAYFNTEVSMVSDEVTQ